MKKLFLVLIILTIVPLAEASEKLKIRQLTATGAVSTDNVASKLISVNFVSNGGPAELDIKDGSTVRYTLAHETSSIGPYNRDTAPIFETDIDVTMRDSGFATFVYIELE